MRRSLLALLLVLLAASLAFGNEEKPKIPPPKLTDVRIWYYPPGGRAQAILWWQPGNIRLQRHVTVSRRGSLRVRVLVSGGFEEDAQGLLNWISVCFRDDNTTLFDLPHERRATRGGIKDIVWRVPEIFASGPLECEVLAWSGRTPKTSLLVGEADRTLWFNLGSVGD